MGEKHPVLTCLCEVQPMQYAIDSHACQWQTQLVLNRNAAVETAGKEMTLSSLDFVLKATILHTYSHRQGSFASLSTPTSLIFSISLLYIQYRIECLIQCYVVGYTGTQKHLSAADTMRACLKIEITQGVPITAQWKWIWLGTMRLQIPSLALLSGWRIRRCHELWCRSQIQLGSGIAVAVV